MSAVITVVDPFDLPDWLGVDEVTWQADRGIHTGHHLVGRLTAEGHEDLPCDLLAVDEAYPVAVVDESTRTSVHQAWQHGQVQLLEKDGRLTLAVPGRSFGADLVLDSLGRLARAVGASPERYAARLRIGADQRPRGG